MKSILKINLKFIKTVCLFTKQFAINCLLFLMCAAYFASCSNEIDSSISKQDSNTSLRSYSADSVYVLDSGFTFTSPNISQTVITAVGNSEWLDNNGGSVWTSYAGPGYSYKVNCRCTGSTGTCQVETNMNHKHWCVAQGGCDNCEMTVLISDAQGNIITQVNNGITIRSY